MKVRIFVEMLTPKPDEHLIEIILPFDDGKVKVTEEDIVSLFNGWIYEVKQE